MTKKISNFKATVSLIDKSQKESSENDSKIGEFVTKVGSLK